jgi:hypothetical protein
MFKQILGMMFVGFTVHSANAQEPTKGLCWEIYAGNKETAPYSALLLNKCDGSSWVLTKTAIADKQGKSTGSWIWRWSPLGTEQIEAVLTLPGGGQYLTTPNR